MSYRLVIAKRRKTEEWQKEFIVYDLAMPDGREYNGIRTWKEAAGICKRQAPGVKIVRTWNQKGVSQ